MLHPEIPRRLTATTLALALAAATLLAAVATPAAADEATYVQKAVRVRVTGLDASTPEGARAIYRRLRAAARAACDDGHDVDADCVRYALAGAVRTLDLPPVTALHGRRSPGDAAGA